MVYTFHTPWNQAETSKAIITAVRRMGGKATVTSPACISAKWRSPYYATIFPAKFMFYVGDGLVRAVTGNSNMDIIVMRFKVRGGFQSFWNYFIGTLLKLYPGVEFGLKPGDVELATVQFVGDGTEQVFVSTSHNYPSLSGAVLGGLLFGTPGAIIGSSYGTSRTTGKVSTQFSGAVLVKARYSNGLLAEGRLQRNSPAYNEILVNMSRYSCE